MKTITKKIDLYSFDELSKEAKEKALREWNECNYYIGLYHPFFQDDLRECIHEELTERGYTHDEITPLYSLNYSQGDGLMFEATVTDKKGNYYCIKHIGHYYHEKSAEILSYNKDGDFIDSEPFTAVYQEICKKVRDEGYRQIEWQESEEYFADTCEANKYTFLSDGTMYNE